MNKIILVSQAPGKSSSEPLAGASGRRLASLAGLDLPQLLARFEHVSLLPEAKGSFDLPAARAHADRLREQWRDRKAVLLGRGVMAAFRLVPDDAAWFQQVEIPPGVEVACMPHPSGISHWWNDPANVERAREFMLRLSVGYFELLRIKPRANASGQPERFRPEQVAAALEAGRGIYSWAAQALAEETGVRVTYQTIANYVERYPQLAAVRDGRKVMFLDAAENNVIRAVEAGDVETSRWLLRSKNAAGRGYELAVDARVKHEGSIEHHLGPEAAKILGKLSPDQVDVLEGIYKVIEDDDATGAAEGADARGPAPGTGAARAVALARQLRAKRLA